MDEPQEKSIKDTKAHDHAISPFARSEAAGSERQGPA